MKNIKYITFVSIITLLLFTNCRQKEVKEVEPKIEVKKDNHEEEPITITTLIEEQMKAVGVTLGTIENRDLMATIKANGNLRVPNNSKASVTSIYGGVIKSLPVEIGDYIKKGQIVATISNPEFIQIQEQYLTVSSKITYAEQEYNRQTELFNNDAGAKKNLQSSTTELKSLKSQLASLKRQLQLMGINPAKVSNKNFQSGLVITSPISGYVSNVIAQIGSYVDISSPIVELIDNNSIHLDLQVFEKDLPRMRVGQIVQFRLTNNPEIDYRAKVYSIGSSFSSDSKTISVHCDVIGSKQGLIDNMNITGIVGIDRSATPAVPNDAIVEADGKFYIFVQTNKKNEEHKTKDNEHDEGIEDHGHESEKNTNKNVKKQLKSINFEKIEIVKGTSEFGFTGITPINDIGKDVKVVIKGAFFINAKMSDSGGEHAH
ncbi:efflux RND transporter periplasmic adaptor subunit [Chishuiella sp.]|uniref:efflux RND transporter periplasmic adaptor subunit n=1 Tax=Chishuiella sp. TaxID=1969467 RepID=UPI0028B265BF|nr:efflux RND transporter periplasmic adaptor subunit [Chishuiella sp.]